MVNILIARYNVLMSFYEPKQQRRYLNFMNSPNNRKTMNLVRSLAVVMLALLLLASALPRSSAEDRARIRTDIAFEYEIQPADGSAVPVVAITSTDYGNAYEKETEKLAFPKLAVRKPAGAKLIMSPGWVGSGQYTRLGNKVYWNDNYTIRSSADEYVTRFYELDLASRSMTVVKELRGKVRHMGRITVFPRAGAYAVYPDTFKLDRTNGVEIYSLSSRKLLARASDAYEPSSGWLEGGSYRQVPAANSIVMKVVSNSTKKPPKGTDYWQDGNNVYVITNTYELAPKGTRKEMTLLSSQATFRWEKKVGGLSYAHYYDAKKKAWLVGCKAAGSSAYMPLTAPGTLARSTFSPSDNYLIVTQYQLLDAKKNKTGTYTTLIVDAKTGKLVRKLPAYARKHTDHYYRWEFGDNLVKVDFFGYARNGYLNLETGLFVGEYQTMPRAAVSYSGDYGEWPDPTTTPFLTLESEDSREWRRLPISAPGVILSDKDVWLVSLKDFAAAVGASASGSSGTWQLAWNGKTWTVPNGLVVKYRDHVFVPFKDLRAAFGAKLHLNAEETVYRYRWE